MTVQFSQIPEILDELRAGKIIVLVDDEDRENEEDIVRGSATVILAMGDGKKAAQSIHNYLNHKNE